jgi:hypothetical protein
LYLFSVASSLRSADFQSISISGNRRGLRRFFRSATFTPLHLPHFNRAWYYHGLSHCHTSKRRKRRAPLVAALPRCDLFRLGASSPEPGAGLVWWAKLSGRPDGWFAPVGTEQELEGMRIELLDISELIGVSQST